MIFHSLLSEKTEDSIKYESLEAPAFFGDLNLDQVINAVTAGKKEYDLKPFFYKVLENADAIEYRHEIFQDLEKDALFESIRDFEQKMLEVHRHLALSDKLHDRYNKEGWFLESAGLYCAAVQGLADGLCRADLKSRGFLAFRDYLTGYVHSDRFTSLLAETKKLEADLSAAKYCLVIKGYRITVRKYEAEIDYGMEVEKVFEKFKRGAVKDYRVKYQTDAGMNHVEEKILKLVARLYPEVFSGLGHYCLKHRNYVDEKICVFEREIQFYISYIEYMEKFKQAGLRFCYPRISTEGKNVRNEEGFDLALASILIAESSPVVCNDFFMRGKERVVVVSGPNQGGKTTFARSFGQLHYLAGIGCPVPGSTAQLYLFDRLFTHFEKEENIRNLRGKLQDDLIRIHEILKRSTPNSIVIMNEIFTSTTLKDAVLLSQKILGRIIELDILCVWVTFIDELAAFSEQTVSMISTVVPEDPATRTYKILRRPADGLAYAMYIVEKHRLTYDHLKERIK